MLAHDFRSSRCQSKIVFLRIDSCNHSNHGAFGWNSQFASDFRFGRGHVHSRNLYRVVDDTCLLVGHRDSETAPRFVRYEDETVNWQQGKSVTQTNVRVRVPDMAHHARPHQKSRKAIVISRLDLGEMDYVRTNGLKSLSHGKRLFIKSDSMSQARLRGSIRYRLDSELFERFRQHHGVGQTKYNMTEPVVCCLNHAKCSDFDSAHTTPRHKVGDCKLRVRSVFTLH